jgi:hypothetical protein
MCDAPGMKPPSLAISDLRVLMSLLPLFDDRRTIRESGAGKPLHLLPGGPHPLPGAISLGPSWARLYETPFQEVLAHGVVAFGFDRELSAAAASRLPMTALVKRIRSLECSEDIQFSLQDAHCSRELEWSALAFATVLHSSMRCLLVFDVHLHELLAQARLHSDDRLLLDAVRIDPMALCSPTGALRLGRAGVARDEAFLSATAKALRGKLRSSEEAKLQKRALVVRTLAESGAESLPDEALEEIFRSLLRLYRPPGKESDPAGALREAVDEQLRRAPRRTPCK